MPTPNYSTLILKVKEHLIQIYFWIKARLLWPDYIGVEDDPHIGREECFLVWNPINIMNFSEKGSERNFLTIKLRVGGEVMTEHSFSSSFFVIYDDSQAYLF